MEERVEVSILLDLYGELLTDNQKAIMNLYYNEDFSLSEISEINNTSRQAIHDTIKRCYKQLVSYENKLNLLSKSIKLEETKQKLEHEIAKIQDEIRDSSIKDRLEVIKKVLMEEISV